MEATTTTLRTTDMEAMLDIRFDCGPSGTYKRTESPVPTQLRVETVTAQVTKPVAGLVSLAPGTAALCFNTRGTLLCKTASNSRLVIVPKESVTFIRGGARLLVQAARGEHIITVVSWNQHLTPLLDSWASSRAMGKGSQGGTRFVACRPIYPNLKSSYERFEVARTGPPELADPLMLSAAYELIALLMTSSDEVQLAAIPANLPETVKELTVKVRRTPSLPWPLRDAADEAGYSPFHFSRVFKAMVGYGFHEYVDRCRTEAAAELLVTTDTPVDLVASQCGFGTTQGLRESVKEYLGLVPSELRTMPDIGGFGGA